jgi:hypothetical protein
MSLDRQTIEFLAKVVDGNEEFRRPLRDATVVLRQRGQRSLFRGTTDNKG